MLLTIFSLILLTAPTIDSAMTKDEKKITGVSKLTKKERKALQAWIDTQCKETAQGVPTPPSVKAPAKHRPVVEEVLQNGHYLKLSDQSSWEINPKDIAITQGWISPSEILVSQSGDAQYPYILTNSLTGSSVRAKKVDQVPLPQSQPVQKQPASNQRLAPGQKSTPSQKSAPSQKLAPGQTTQQEILEGILH